MTYLDRKLRLLGPRILVRRLATPDQLPSGLWVPKYWVSIEGPGGATEMTEGRELPSLGHVVARGAYRGGRPVELDVGDLVQFPKFHPRRVFLDGEDLLEVRMDEILARIET